VAADAKKPKLEDSKDKEKETDLAGTFFIIIKSILSILLIFICLFNLFLQRMEATRRR
jgi:hypothetical protein